MRTSDDFRDIFIYSKRKNSHKWTMQRLANLFNMSKSAVFKAYYRGEKKKIALSTAKVNKKLQRKSKVI